MGRSVEGRAVGEIHRLPLCETAIDVVQQQLGGNPGLQGGNRHTGADPADVNDPDLHPRSCRASCNMSISRTKRELGTDLVHALPQPR